MDLSLGGVADSSALAVGSIITEPPRVEPGLAAGESTNRSSESEAAEATDTEFWDACWTLEDEWHPHVAISPLPDLRSRPKASGAPCL
jgi:hypothetical protein